MTSIGTAPSAMTAEDAAVADRVIRFAQELRPELVQRQGESEATTFIPEDLHRRFADAGLYRLWIPKAHGGLEVDPWVYYRVVVELARGDMSLAWCFALSANHALMFANWFPEEIHAEVFNGGDFRAASLAAPAVDAVRAEGGYILNGTAPFCSGIPWSTYFLGQARLEGNRPDGSRRLGIYIAPRSAFEQLNDWGDMHGLNGSGSHSIRFTDSFLPERFMIEDADLRTFGFSGDSPGSQAYGNAMYSGRHGSSFALILAALVLGGGYNALDEFENQMRARTITVPPFTPRTEDGEFLRYYGQTRVRLAIIEGALFDAVAQWTRFAQDNVAGREPFTVAKDNLLAAVGRELMIDVWRVVTANLWEYIGASASRRGQRFERVFRDIAQAAAHRNPQLRDIMYKVVAQQELGLDGAPAGAAKA